MPRRTIAITALLLAAALAAGVAGCAKRAPEPTGDSSGFAAPIAAIDPAQQEGCFATERAVESQVAAYQAQNPGATAPAGLADMVAQGMLRSAPACPAGGSYTYDPAQATLTCSVHGHY